MAEKKVRKNITILLPTLNEEEGVGCVIDEIPFAELDAQGYGVNVLVVDANSTDRTRDVAHKKGAAVVIQDGNGKGVGLRQAFSKVDADYIFMLDADGTYSPSYIPKMVRMLEEGFDVVLGSRLDGYIEKGAMSRLNYFGNRMLTLLANTLFGTKISDVCTGLWGFKKTVVKNIELNSDFFEIEAEIFATCVKNKYRIGELRIAYRNRKGKGKLNAFAGLSIARKLIGRKFVSLIPK